MTRLTSKRFRLRGSSGWSVRFYRDGVDVGQIAFDYFYNGSAFVRNRSATAVVTVRLPDTLTTKGAVLAKASTHSENTLARADKWARAYVRSLDLDALFSTVTLE